MSSPLVTILMAAHNAERHVGETLDSLRRQTLTDYELICIDDASTDATPEVLSRAAAIDPRVILLRNPDNIGLAASLNRGLEQARGEFIARADADDLYSPEHLARKVRALQQDSSLVIVSCQHRPVNDAGKPAPAFRETLPQSDTALRWRLLFNSCFWHPAVVWRRSVDLRYDTTYHVAQDYELWTRMAAKGRMLCLPQRDFIHRLHDRSISATRLQEQIQNRDALSARMLEREFGAANTPDHDTVTRWRSMFVNQFKPRQKPSGADVRAYFSLLSDFCRARKWDDEAVALWRAEALKQALYLFRTGGFDGYAPLLRALTSSRSGVSEPVPV